MYPAHKSSLFRLRGKNKFEKLFNIKLEDVELIANIENYRVWTNPKGREIQEPIGKVKKFHESLNAFLCRIEPPNYLKSKKGSSHIDNALSHASESDKNLIKTDISKFFSSVTKKDVACLFLYEFECSKDIAHAIAELCCYKNAFLPTGSCLSQRLAFMAKRAMFDEIFKLAQTENCVLTVYVDDITVSGDRATKEMLANIRQIIRVNNLKTSNKKSLTYAASTAKQVTGMILKNNSCALPNKHHKEIFELKNILKNSNFKSVNLNKNQLQLRLNGKISYKEQVSKYKYKMEAASKLKK